MIRSASMVMLLLLAPASAQAGTSAVGLEWEADPSCPSGEAVRASIAALLGPGQDVHVAARVVRNPDGTFTGAIAPTGRTIAGASCAEVADAIAVVVAIAASPGPVAEPPVAEAAAEPSPAAEPALPAARVEIASVNPREHERVAPSRAPEERGSFLVGADAVAFAGMFGTTAPAAAITLAWGRGPLRLQLGATYVPAVTVERAELLASGTFALALGAAGACWMPSLGRWSGGVCAHVDAGRMSARGFGLAVSPLHEARPWVAARAGGSAAWRIASRVALRAEIAAVVPLTRDDFVIANVGAIDAAPPVALRSSLGVEMHFR